MIYRNLSNRKKKIINRIGIILFGLPFSYFVFFKGFQYFFRSYQLGESSKETGGLPAIYILKFFICFLGIALFLEFLRFIFTKNE